MNLVLNARDATAPGQVESHHRDQDGPSIEPGSPGGRGRSATPRRRSADSHDA